MAVTGTARVGAGSWCEAGVELVYPADALIVVGGVPGAGKSTLLARVSAGGPVMDSARLREHWRCRSRVWDRLPYRTWRPLLHAVHYVLLIRRIARAEPLIVHDCLTRPWVRLLLGVLARRARLGVHLILLDVSEAEAFAGQRCRRRMVGRLCFARHCRRWRALVPLAARNPAAVVPGARSAVILNRPMAGRLRSIRHAAMSTS